MSWPNCGWLDEATLRTSGLDGTKARNWRSSIAVFMVNSAPLFMRRGHFYLRKSSGSLAIFTHDAPRLVFCEQLSRRSTRRSWTDRGRILPATTAPLWQSRGRQRRQSSCRSPPTQAVRSPSVASIASAWSCVMGAWARALNSHQRMRGAETPGGKCECPSDFEIARPRQGHPWLPSRFGALSVSSGPLRSVDNLRLIAGCELDRCIVARHQGGYHG